MPAFSAKSFTRLGAVLLAVFLACSAWGAGTPDKPKKKLLYFTRSQGFEHSVVKRQGDQLAHSEKILVELGSKNGYEIIPTKDGAMLAPDKIKQYDGFIFYATGDWSKPGGDNQPPTPEGAKEALLEAVTGGKGFVGIHAGNDSYRVKTKKPDPFIAMLGGEFLAHGQQQVARQRVSSPKFPGMDKAGEGFELNDEWYVAKNLAHDLHVILVQETKGMKGEQYKVPPYPATWARLHGKGRVYYNSMGHREDVWENPLFQNILIKGIAWAMGDIDFQIKPNVHEVTPDAIKELGAE